MGDRKKRYLKFTRISEIRYMDDDEHQLLHNQMQEQLQSNTPQLEEQEENDE